MKSKQAKWVEFSVNERYHIYNRDKEKCIVCSGNTFLGIAHLIPRSKGGKGDRRNGVLLCQICHEALDSNGSKKNYQTVKSYVEGYIKKHYGEFDREELIYNKWRS
jgi:5-methylcytosine-specific restriction endonuclease McrA